MIGDRGGSGVNVRRPAELDQDLGARHGKALARADVERHAVPAPGVDLELHGGERFDARVVARPLFLCGIRGTVRGRRGAASSSGNRPQDFDLFVADRLAVGARRRLHRQVGQHLEHVVLDDVADGPRLLVERAAPLDAEVLRHRDLHAFDVVAVPDRFQETCSQSGNRAGCARAICPGNGRCGRSTTRRNC